MGQYNLIKPDTFPDGVHRSHHFRYYAARGYVEPNDVVVDAACGSGFGVEILSRIARKVVGIERDIEALRYATVNHKRANNYFIRGNLDQMQTYPTCDVFISLETIEHLRYPESFAGKAKFAAKKYIILSCPVIPTKHEDSTHLQDFTEQQIHDLFVDDRWSCVDSARQGPYLLISFYRK